MIEKYTPKCAANQLENLTRAQESAPTAAQRRYQPGDHVRVIGDIAASGTVISATDEWVTVMWSTPPGLPVIDIDIETKPIYPTVRKLRARWSPAFK